MPVHNPRAGARAVALSVNAEITRALDSHKASFAERGWLTIPNFLTEESAQSIRSELAAEDRWELTTLREGRAFVGGVNEFVAQPPQFRSEFINNIMSDARTGPFQFFYEYIRLIGADTRSDIGYDELRGFMGSPELLGLLRNITGAHGAVSIDAQLTRYVPSQFLMQHTDAGDDAMGHRLVAYVLNLCGEWNPDWGGLLHLLDDSGQIEQTLIPAFNQLALFSVPRRHFVSQVASFCPRERISITGWLLRNQA